MIPVLVKAYWVGWSASHGMPGGGQGQTGVCAVRKIPGALSVLRVRNTEYGIAVQDNCNSPPILEACRCAFAAETGREYWTGIAGTANQRFHRQKELGLTARR